MKRILKLEEMGMFVATIALFALLDVVWWVYPAILLAPDIGILGYLVSPKFGAGVYNLFHHKGVAVLGGLMGLLIGSTPLVVAGLVLFGHASMDRMFGYGLKFPDAFSHTHLGWLNGERRGSSRMSESE